MRSLIEFSQACDGIAVFRDGHFEIMEPNAVVAGLRPGDVMDFVRMSSGHETLLVSDTRITDLAKILAGAEFVPLSDIPISTESWVLPLSLEAIVARSMGNRDDAWRVLEQVAGGYLAKGAIADHTKPWKNGLVGAVVRSRWKEWKKLGAVPDESYWGWLRKVFFIENGGEGWPLVKARLEGWIRAADVFLRNVEGHDWIAALTLDQILQVPISKAVRCCGPIRDGLLSYSDSLRKALFNPSVTVADMNHLLGVARGQRDKIPERVVDEDTGEVTYVVPNTDEIVPPEEIWQVLDPYIPEIGGPEIEVPKAHDIHGVYWTYNYTAKAFGYWEYGTWIPALSVQTDNERVTRFIDQIIAACKVASEYD